MPSSNGFAPALVLFDIDGTLLRRAGPHHGQALIRAVAEITGLTATAANIPVQGMLDSDIFTWMLREAGQSEKEIRNYLPALMRRAQYLYVRDCPADLTDKVCPGVREFLAALRSARTIRALVTGNLPQIGWKKMERAGLKPFFHFGAFAGKAKTRAGLAQLAIAEARAKGWITRKTPITLIGDHPNDILAAKTNHVRSVAVATGIASRDELATHNPDLLIDDLRALSVETLLQ